MAKKTKDSNISIEERLEQALIPNWDEPYKLPDNWCWTNLGNLCKIINGFAFKSNKFSDTNGTPVIRITNIKDGYVDIENSVFTIEEAIDEKFVVCQGDLLVAMSGATTGKNGVYRENKRAFLNQRVGNIKIINTNVLTHEFRNYYIAYMQDEILKSAYGGAQPNISSERICQFPFALPPLAEQKRISNLLEKLFAKLDESKEKAQEVVDGFESRKAAILHKAFSGELTAKWRKENKVSFEEWENLTLDDVADYKKGPFGSSITKAMFVPKAENTFKVYEQGNAIKKTLDYGSYYISQKKYEELKGFAVKPGDIIVSCAGTIGEIYKLPNHCEAGVINQALMRVRVYSNINELYFIYYFTGVLKGDVIGEANGTAIKNIPPFKVLKAMNILLPSLPEQNEIVEILDCMLSKEQQIKETAEAVIEQINTMKKAILARAFRGELGTNDPSEESAVELLKKVIFGGEN